MMTGYTKAFLTGSRTFSPSLNSAATAFLASQRRHRRRGKARQVTLPSRIVCSRLRLLTTRDLTHDDATIGARCDARSRSEPARIRNLLVRQCRPCRRSRTGNVSAGHGEYRLVPTRDEHVGMALHDSP